jgi:predicted nicotinamide N-methyase
MNGLTIQFLLSLFLEEHRLFSQTDTRKEINPASETVEEPVTHVPGFPHLSCGWILRIYSIDERSLQLMVPHHPDALLDDPAVLAANATDDYMPYWAYLWPAAIHMARSVLKSQWAEGTRVLELGCGVGLVGISALAAGCQVTLTDYDVMSVAVAKRNAELNGFTDFQACTLDWRSPPPDRYPVIFGCDITYEQRNHAPILDLVQQLLEPEGVCWLADGGRAVSADFWNLARSRNFEVTIRNEDGERIESPGIHYQLFELRHRVS